MSIDRKGFFLQVKGKNTFFSLSKTSRRQFIPNQLNSFCIFLEKKKKTPPNLYALQFFGINKS